MDLLVHRMAQKDIRLHVSDEVYAQIAKMGVDPVYGARPMKRYIQRNVETLIARKLIESGNMRDEDVYIDFIDGEYQIRIQ